ncbi:site-2 protease family protein [Candidatus Woesebacteria bacterium]|nr:site-2 protease family protein [Candidatus Woesebacteria bacterium]
MSVPIPIQIITLLFAVIVHEMAHGWMANKLGDPTAKAAGRITLNPLPHIDLYGSILIPLTMIILGSPFVIGWAKPVPFNSFYLKNPRKDAALISLSGPVSNLLTAVACSIVLNIIARVLVNPFYESPLITQFLLSFIQINVVLAVFNLIPIHPLDGGKILIGLLPEEEAEEADLFLKRYGTLILFFMIFPIFGGTSPAFMVITPVMNFVLTLLMPSAQIV